MDLGAGLVLPQRKTGSKPARKCPRRSIFRRQQRKKGLNININRRIRNVKTEMEWISQEQKGVKEVQEKLREKLTKVGTECNQLRKETELLSKQRAETQIRLNLLFEILKAKEDCDLPKVTNLILHLRELMRKQNNPQ